MKVTIETDQRTPSWDIPVGDDEPMFLGVQDYELDDLKEQLGFIVLEKDADVKCYTMHERAVTVEANLLRQMIMTCERYHELRKSQKRS